LYGRNIADDDNTSTEGFFVVSSPRAMIAID